MLKKLFNCFLILCFFFVTVVPSQVFAGGLGLPEPGTMVGLSKSFEPAIIKGLVVHQDNPFLFNFIVDPGQDELSGDALKKEGERLIKYFLASLALPEKDVWVNLSPYEKDKTIPEALSQTDMGRDLLAQDYILKQLTASIIYPEQQLGKSFWDKVYAKAQKEYGTTDIALNTFNKVWIVADKASIFERNNTAFVVESHLRVMLEEDYLAFKENKEPVNTPANNVSSQIIREIVLPEIEKEVNSGKNFANLRQIFNSIILASWYKKNLKQALLNRIYADQSKVNGIDINDPTVKQQIYEQYLKAFQKGVFNYVKEDIDAADGKMIPRKYFSGGILATGAASNPDLSGTPEQLASSLSSGREFVSIETGVDLKITSDESGGIPTDFAAKVELMRTKHVLWDEESSLLDKPTGKSMVGGKSHEIALSWKENPKTNFRSFSGTATASVDFLMSDPKLLSEIYRITQELDASDEAAREEAGKKIRALIAETPVPAEIEQTIREGYQRLVKITQQPSIAVRSSGRAEDISLKVPELEGITLGANAGQHDTYLGVIGEEAAVKRWKDCVISLYTARVLGYRDGMMVFSSFGKILPQKELTKAIIEKLKASANADDQLVAKAFLEKNILIISSLKLMSALERNGFSDAVDLVKASREEFTKLDNIAMGVTFMPMAGVDISFVVMGHEITTNWTGMGFQNIPVEEYFNKGRVAVITTNYGIGESIVQGAVMPDSFLVHVFEDEDGPHINILARTLGTKLVQTVYVVPVIQELELDDQTVGMFVKLLNTSDVRTFEGYGNNELYNRMHLAEGANLSSVKDVLDRLIKERVDLTSSIAVSEEEMALFQYDRGALNRLAHLLKALSSDLKIKTMFTDVPEELRNQFSATEEQVRNIALEFMEKSKGFEHLIDMEGAVGTNFGKPHTAVTVQRRSSNVTGDVKEPGMIRINYTYVKTVDLDAIRQKRERIEMPGGQLSNIFAGDQLVQGIPTRNSFSGVIYKIDESMDLTHQFEEIKRLADSGQKVIIRTNETTPDYIDTLKYKNVMGVIANSGGATSHAAVVSRELGIATVVGVQGWLDKLVDIHGVQRANELSEYLNTSGNIVTVDANANEETGLGTIYAGELPVSTRDIEINLQRLPDIYTKIGYIMGMPHPMLAMSKMSQYDGYYGVALMRGEFAYAEENINPRAGRAYDLLVVEDYLKTIAGDEAATNYFNALSPSEKQALDKYKSFLDRRLELRRQGLNIPLDVTEKLIESGLKSFEEGLTIYEKFDINLMREHGEELGRLTKQVGGYISYNEFFDAVHGGAVGTMAAANSQTDNTVVYRSIDFKKNEAAELIGSRIFDPVAESATMVGERGARWLLRPENKVILVEEIRMLLRLVEKGYKNIGFMFPFVSTPKELDQLLTILFEEEKAFSQEKGRPVYLREVGQMTELPSNVVQAEEFIKVLKKHEDKTKAWFKSEYNVDINRHGFLSFGTNDLTQLTLGADRDNPRMRQLFNEAHPFVIESIRHVVNMAREYGIKCGLCGQALVNLVTVDPDMAEEILMLLGSTGGYAGTDYLGTVPAITRSASATLKHGRIEADAIASAEVLSSNFESNLEKGAAVRPLYQVTNREDLAKTYVGDFIFVHDGILFEYATDDKVREQLSRLGAIIYTDDKLADVIKAISEKLRVPVIKATSGIERLAAVPSGEKVTADFSRRSIYRGGLDVSVDLPETASKINVKPQDHADIAPIEFNETVRANDLYRDLGVYPSAFLAYDNPESRGKLDAETVAEIERLIEQTDSKSAVDVLRHEIKGRITARMVHPNTKMVYETSDMQSDDAHSLLGHEVFEQEEVNPPLGYNGLEALMGDAQLKALFRVEMETIKSLIDEGFNISIQFNSIKTPDSLQKAMDVLKEVGIDVTKVDVGMNTAWPGNYLFLQSYLGHGLSFVTLDERNLAKAYLAADLYKNERVRNTYQWEGIKDDIAIPAKMIEEAIATFSAQNHEVAMRRIAFDSTTPEAVSQANEIGGINLNTEGMIWTIRKDGTGIDMNIDPVWVNKFEQEGIRGLSPVILNITPVSDVWLLVGMTAPLKEDVLLTRR
ncbi:MAG: hypothetical protein KA403_00675 [Candidatus Omnitrophica bacterium]|nr:hypothetical protein [Candidatus Omnitrophota bacterium]